MKKRLLRVVFVLLLAAFVVLVAWGYNYTSPVTARASEDWSRGYIVGRTDIGRPVAMRSLPDGGVVMVWPNESGRMQLVTVGVDGEVILDQSIPFDTWTARDPQVQIGLDGRLHLVWRERGEPNATIRYALLEADGAPVLPPRILSNPSHWVADPPRLLLDALGNAHAVWSDELGIHWAMLGPDGQSLEEPRLLVPEGRYPSIQLDEDGRLHLAWQQQMERNNRGLFYQSFDTTTGESGEMVEVARIFRRTGQWVEGPVLGLDLEMGYVMWILQDRREFTSKAYYVYFPLELPRQTRRLELRMSRGTDPTGLWVLEGQQSPVLVAASETVGSRWDAVPQVVLFALVRGETPEYERWGRLPTLTGGRSALLSYVSHGPRLSFRIDENPLPQERRAEHIVTASPLPSLKPTLVVDGQSNFHLAWLEPDGFDRYRVVYASTSSMVQENYNTFTLWDFTNPLLTSIFRLSLATLVVGPFVVLWVLVPMGLLAVYHLVSGVERLNTRAARIVLLVVLLLEVFLTMLVPPFNIEVPFWPILRWLSPVVTAGVATLVTWRFMRRSWESPLFELFFVFTAVHVSLQMAMYLLL
jgi:hypothetical protein